MIGFNRIVAAVFLLTSTIFSSNPGDNEKCFRCHSMPTFGVRDEQSGFIVNLSVNRNEFQHSNHHNLACINCHSEKFQQFPHSKELKKENLICSNCHKDKKELAKYEFSEIKKQFDLSIHKTKLGDKFTCFNCHDPHSFKINARYNSDVKGTINFDNFICLNCHNSIEKIQSISGVTLPSLNDSHNWLPHPELHWKSVRCIECHTKPVANGVSHIILPKENAVKNCVECHSADSKLLHTLYKFQSKEMRNKQGFINAVILNDSYVIGATRNYYLNIISFIIFGLTILGISIHGFLRYSSKKRKGNEK